MGRHPAESDKEISIVEKSNEQADKDHDHHELDATSEYEAC